MTIYVVEEEYVVEQDGGRRKSDGLQQALIGATAVAAVAGAALLIGSRVRAAREPLVLDDDAPPHTARGRSGKTTLVGRSITINKPRQELYDFWRNFTNLPHFMDNIEAVERLDDKRSRWTIKAPAGTSIAFVSRVTEDVPGSLIAWESEPGASVWNAGRIEFVDAPPGRGTNVRAAIEYEPPAGTVGRLVAKLFQREPNVQARRDLRRFKQLMETGEVTSSASPSARKSENPTEQYL